MSEYSGLSSGYFMKPEQARQNYNLTTRALGIFSSETEIALAHLGVATIDMPVGKDDFSELYAAYDECQSEANDLLLTTSHDVDARFGNNAGHVRKEPKFDSDGNQIQDGKSVFHFNEHARERWEEQFKDAPQILRSFLDAGYDIHSQLIGVAHLEITELENTHPNMRRAYFEQRLGRLTSHSYFRIADYDGYQVKEDMLQVAKPHFDIGGWTIQADASAPGFWIAPDGPDGERKYYDTQDGKAYIFPGKGHEKVYGPDSVFKATYHGVDRIVPTDVEYVPSRKAGILFVDMPYVDFETQPEDTLPYLKSSTDSKVA